MFTAYDGDPEPILTPDYGEVVIKYEKWGQYPNGTYYDMFEDLETHYCTDAELGIENGDGSDKARFWPIHTLYAE